MNEQLVAMAFVSAIGIAFGLGIRIGWHAARQGCCYEIQRLREDNSRLRSVNAAHAFESLFRPVDEDAERRVLAEWITEYDPTYHETETE